MARPKTGPDRIKPLSQFDQRHMEQFVRELNSVLLRMSEKIDRSASNLKLTGDLDLNGFRLKNVGTPRGGRQAVTVESLEPEIRKIVEETVAKTATDSEAAGASAIGGLTSGGGDGSGGGGDGAVTTTISLRSVFPSPREITHVPDFAFRRTFLAPREIPATADYAYRRSFMAPRGIV